MNEFLRYFQLFASIRDWIRIGNNNSIHVRLDFGNHLEQNNHQQLHAHKDGSSSPLISISDYSQTSPPPSSPLPYPTLTSIPHPVNPPQQRCPSNLASSRDIIRLQVATIQTTIHQYLSTRSSTFAQFLNVTDPFLYILPVPSPLFRQNTPELRRVLGTTLRATFRTLSTFPNVDQHTCCRRLSHI